MASNFNQPNKDLESLRAFYMDTEPKWGVSTKIVLKNDADKDIVGNSNHGLKPILLTLEYKNSLPLSHICVEFYNNEYLTETIELKWKEKGSKKQYLLYVDENQGKFVKLKMKHFASDIISVGQSRVQMSINEFDNEFDWLNQEKKFDEQNTKENLSKETKQRIWKSVIESNKTLSEKIVFDENVFGPSIEIMNARGHTNGTLQESLEAVEKAMDEIYRNFEDPIGADDLVPILEYIFRCSSLKRKLSYFKILYEGVKQDSFHHTNEAKIENMIVNCLVVINYIYLHPKAVVSLPSENMEEM